MKTFIGALCIFSILVALVLTNSFYVKNTLKNISELATELETSDSKKEKDDIIDIWNNNRTLLSLSIEADELERMNDLIQSLESADSTNNLAEFQKYCRLISELALELLGYEQISIEGIL